MKIKFSKMMILNPLGTPPGQTPPQSPNGQRIQRSNSACIGNAELLPCRHNAKLFNKRRNTQLLQSNVISNQVESANSLPVSQVFYDHRLQSNYHFSDGKRPFWRVVFLECSHTKTLSLLSVFFQV